MPSFDTVCEPNLVEVKNAVDTTAKEIATRFDFKGTSAAIALKDKEITLFGDADFQITQVDEVLSTSATWTKAMCKKLAATKSNKSFKCAMASLQKTVKKFKK